MANAQGWTVRGSIPLDPQGIGETVMEDKGFVRLTLRAAQCRDAHSTIPLPSASLSA